MSNTQSSGRSRPSDKNGGGGGTGPLGLSLVLKKGGQGAGPLGPFSWICHCKGYIQIPNLFQAFRLWSVVFSLLTSPCIILTILTPGAGYQTPQSWPFPLRPTVWTYPDISCLSRYITHFLNMDFPASENP